MVWHGFHDVQLNRDPPSRKGVHTSSCWGDSCTMHSAMSRKMHLYQQVKGGAARAVELGHVRCWVMHWSLAEFCYSTLPDSTKAQSRKSPTLGPVPVLEPREMCSLVLYGLQRTDSRARLLQFLGQYQGRNPSKEHVNSLAIQMCLLVPEPVQ